MSITSQNNSIPNFKITMCGDSGVGKSTLTYHYIKEGKPAELKSTIPVELSEKTVEFNGHKYKLQFWDTVGQERYRSIVTSFFRDSHAIILVYDVTNMESFENLNYWFETVRENCYRIDTLFALAGNKLDLKNKIVIDKNKADSFAKEKNIKISLQVSAFTGQNVYHLFDTLSSQLSITFSDYLTSFGSSDTPVYYNLPLDSTYNNSQNTSSRKCRCK